MKKMIALTFFLAITLQPLYSEIMTDENGYVNKPLQKQTYFAGQSSLEESQNLQRKPASIEKKSFYQKYFESKEDRFSNIWNLEK